MDVQRVPLLNWSYFYQEKGMEELRQTLVLTTMELESTRSKAEEELKMKDAQIIQLKYLLEKAITERDEAEDKCQALILEKLFLHQQQNHQSSSPAAAPASGISSIEDEPRKGIDSNNVLSSSDCEESIVSSPNITPIPPPLEDEFPFLPHRPLPEKGNLLQAVIKAGPLLQTLLLAGPLPQWRHPPPPLDTCQIPPPPLIIPSSSSSNSFVLQDPFISSDGFSVNVNNCGRISRKISSCEGIDTSIATKYQRLLLP